MSGMHFERMAAQYATARPPYPPVVYEALAALGVIGPGVTVLEIGAGAGLATQELVASGCRVTAVEPGRRLAELLRAAVPTVDVVVARLEDADLPAAGFDAAVAATSMHWVELPVGLSILHRALRPGGWLAVWRTVFGDDAVPRSTFRERVDRLVAARAARPETGEARERRPTVEELTEGGWFTHVDSMRWRWSVDLTAAQIRSLFSTFSDWAPSEAAAAAAVAEQCGGVVTEHYVSVLHVLAATRRAEGTWPVVTA